MPGNLVEMFQASAAEHADQTAMRYKRDDAWQSLSYDALRRLVEDLAGGLVDLGVEPGDRVAIWSANRPEWVLADYATLHAGAVTVPVYETLTPDQAEHILADSGAQVVFVEDAEALDAVLAAGLDGVEHVVTLGPLPAGYDDKDGIRGLPELYARGGRLLEEDAGELEARVRGIEAGDLATLVYTSGTTGTPKGVKLTHRNLASNVDAVTEALPIAGEEHLAFLPLAHAFARTGDEFVPYSTGSTVAFAEGVEALGDNLRELSPTIMLSVPRVYEKMHARIRERLEEAGPVGRRVARWALGVAEEVARREDEGEDVPFHLRARYALADRLVLGEVREAAGGRLKFFVSGGAALSPDVARFFAAVGLDVMQGYGLTETSPVVAANTPEAVRLASVGRPLPGVDVRIDEDAWDGAEDEGEIQVKGPNVTEGYWERPAATEALFTEDGWLRSGDVGTIDEDGFLHVTDRLKTIFKTAYGKYIVPNKIEGKLTERPFVAQAVVVGEEKKYVAALLTPDLERLEAWAEEQGLKFGDPRELVEREAVRKLFAEQVEAVNEDLARYESIKDFAVLARELDAEHGELTPTLKVKRRVVHENWADAVDGLYPDD